MTKKASDIDTGALSPLATFDLPLIPIRGDAILPKAISPLSMGRASSVRALQAMGKDRMVGVFVQLDPDERTPSVDQLHQLGTAVLVLRVGNMDHAIPITMAFVEGMHRIRIREILQSEPYLRVRVEVLKETSLSTPDEERALTASIHEIFGQVSTLSTQLSPEVASLAMATQNSSQLVDFVAASLPGLSCQEKQDFLETLEVSSRMRKLVACLLREREGLRLREKLQSEIKENMAGLQREVLLREQLKLIHRELGDEEEACGEVDELRGQLELAGLPVEARREADRELNRLTHVAVGAAEYSVISSYLEWLAALPWQPAAAETIDLPYAARVLDADHHGLAKVKQRILEQLAVFQLKHDVKGLILCFTGPPGVGKTSLGRSIAKAMQREFVRISLGGMHDEAEIRGHRRTYVGSLPGQIIRGMRRAGTSNPVILLDEIDKIGNDFRGDPASALLEVLDPEQNANFRDHYLGVPFDLSRVLFLTTANQLDPIPRPLLDRMEVIELPGYSEEEKLRIAQQHLVCRQVRDHALTLGKHLQFTDEGVMAILRGYTREAGVRELERGIAAICRKRARQLVEVDSPKLVVGGAQVRRFLGRARYEQDEEIEERTHKPGVSIGLAWTPYGGEVLFVEASRMLRDRGEFTITGQVRSVMEESARASLSWVRANSHRYGIPRDSFRQYDIHMHIPSGGVPKDGPSAGLVMVSTMLSLFLDLPIRSRVAMTGEITLSGHVLPVGGIKEKVLAARRCGILEVVMPSRNRQEFQEEIPPALRAGMRFHFVREIDEAMALVFEERVAVELDQLPGATIM